MIHLEKEPDTITSPKDVFKKQIQIETHQHYPFHDESELPADNTSANEITGAGELSDSTDQQPLCTSTTPKPRNIP